MDLNKIDSKDVDSVSRIVSRFVFAGLAFFAVQEFKQVSDSAKSFPVTAAQVEKMAGSLDRIEKSVSSLNQNMAVTIEKQNQHSKILKYHDGKMKDLDDRIRDLETKKN